MNQLLPRGGIFRPLALLMVMITALTAHAYDFEVDGIYYNLNGNTVSVTSGSSKYSGDIAIPETVAYNSTTYTVTEIGERAFKGCGNLKSIEIPNSVTGIGDNAFNGCSGLPSIEIPNSVTVIGENAFNGCSGLTSIEIPNSVTSIGNYAFSRCSGLTSIEIPNSVTVIGENAFNGCSELVKSAYPSTISNPFSNGTALSYPADNCLFEDGFIYNANKTAIWFAPLTLSGEYQIPRSVTEIGHSAFRNCSGLTNVEIPNSVTSISHSAFYNCSGLTSIKIPNSVTEIGPWAFSGCAGLTSIEIPNSVTSISEFAFQNCSGLTSVVIPNSVSSTGGGAFNNCAGLKSLRIEDGDSQLSLYTYTGSSRSYYPFSNCKIETLYVGRNLSSWEAIGNSSSLKSVEIGNSVTEIGESAFYSCSGLTSMVIPSSVTEIGSMAFRDCYHLKSLRIEDGDSQLSLYSDNSSYYPFRGCKIATLYVGRNLSSWTDLSNSSSLTSVEIGNSVSEIGTEAFRDCTDLASVEIGNSVTEIGYGTFWGCSGLTSIVIPNTITSIGNSAFRECTRLAGIEIPNSVTEIGALAFQNCTGLNSLRIEDGDSQLSLYSDNSTCYPFSGCKIGTLYIGRNLSSWRALCNSSSLKSVEIGNSVAGIGGSAFSGCSGLTSMVIPNSVTEIGEYTFSDCSGLTSMVIPNSVTEIGKYAFSGCSGLTSIEIPNSVTKIGSDAFRNCSGLTSAVISDSVTEIGDATFYGCSGLTSIKIPDSVTSIGNAAFRNCTLLTSIEIPDSLTSIGNWAFSNCRSLTSIEIPNSLTSIGEYAFYDCYDLASIVIPDSVTEIGIQAFNGCHSLTSIEIPNSVTEIGESTFSDCHSLTNLVIPNSVTSIGNSAFSRCYGLTSIVIPNSVTSIGLEAFYGCSGLKSLRIEDGDSQLSLYQTYILSFPFKNCKIETLYVGRNLSSWKALCASSSLKSVEIGNSVTEIDNYAFSGCIGLTSVTISASVETIGAKAFSDCTGLTDVTALSESPCLIQSDTFAGAYDTANLHIPDGSSQAYQTTPYWYLFKNLMVGDTELPLFTDDVFNYRLDPIAKEATLIGVVGTNNTPSIPDRVVYENGDNAEFYKVTAIGGMVFANSDITAVKLSKNLKAIGGEAFSGCNNLTSVALPESLDVIGDRAFYQCGSLEAVTFPKHLDILGAYSFYDCKGLTQAALTAKMVGEYAFYNTSLSSFDFSETETIGASAFKGCQLTEINIPASVQSIGSKAFADNSTVSSFTLADSTEPLELPSDMLNNATVSSLYLGRNFPGGTFTGLTTLTIGNLVTELPEGAFKDSSSLNTLTLGSGLTEIPANAFSGCSALTDVVIPKNVTAVADNAFANCSNATRIAIGAEITNIGEKAFDGINAAGGVYVTAVEPPMAANNTFSNYDVPLYVPQESVDTYYNFPRCWYRFSGEPLVVPTAVNAVGDTNIKGAKPGEKYQLQVTVEPANVSVPDIFWHSTNPAVAIVDNNGYVTVLDPEMTTFDNTGLRCEIIAETLYADAPVATFTINVGAQSGIDNIVPDEVVTVRANDVYNMQGVLLMRNANADQISTLRPGIYIIGGKKVLVN